MKLTSQTYYKRGPYKQEEDGTVSLPHTVLYGGERPGHCAVIMYMY